MGVEKHDSQETADKLLHKVTGYRIFCDDQGKMNLSLKDIDGELLVVSQFTLAADTKKGMRPSFSSAASPALGELLYEYFVAQATKTVSNVATGQFGADMKVHLVNDGPVTFNLLSLRLLQPHYVVTITLRFLYITCVSKTSPSKACKVTSCDLCSAIKLINK